MSSAGDCSISHTRRHQPDDGGDSQRAESAQPQSDDSDPTGSSAARASSTDPPTNLSQMQPQSLHSGEVEPLPEQISIRVRPRLSSHMGRLAVVELQLVLQWLDPRSRLTAARCNRRLLHAADHPFAWSAAKPFDLSSRRHAEPGALIRRSLLRHTPIALTLSSAVSASQVALIPRLRELHDLGYLSPDLMALPAMQRLQTLRLLYSWQQPIQRLQLAVLPELHTLHIGGHVRKGSDEWSWLPAMPALADLSLIFFPDDQVFSVPPLMEAAIQCTLLHSLRLHSPHFIIRPGVWARLCATTAMRRLRHLEIKSFASSWAAASEDEWRAGFNQLAQLESLCLNEVQGVNWLLPLLAHAPALRTLTLPCRVIHPGICQASTHPRREGLLELLGAAPQLHVRLQLASFEQWRSPFSNRGRCNSAYDRQVVDEQWHRLQRMAAEIERVAVVDIEHQEQS